MTEYVSLDARFASLLVRTMALMCVRNTALEDIHAGRVPVTRTGDFSDVMVVDADGRRIPWPQVSHFDDDAMRDLMREIVDKLYTFQIRSREPGFLECIGIWMRSASRWDEPKIDASFMPGSVFADGAATFPFVGFDGGRFAFAPHPEPNEDMVFRINIFLEDTDGSQWWVETDLIVWDLETAHMLAATLNGRLGLDVVASAAFAERVLAANPMGRHPRDSPE